MACVRIIEDSGVRADSDDFGKFWMAPLVLSLVGRLLESWMCGERGLYASLA
jgi:hypothetical protein